MRHSRFACSYSALSPSLEVTKAELLADGIAPSVESWTCETIAQMGIPRSDLSRTTQPEKISKSPRCEITVLARSQMFIARRFSGM